MTIKKILFLSLLVSQQCVAFGVKDSNQKIRVLVLIAASDDLPVYAELHKMWRRYMNVDTDHFEVYFSRANSDLKVPCVIDGDTIWARAQESIIPGLINKTVFQLEYFLPRIIHEFDYVLRTTLGSFIVFPRLVEYLKKAPRKRFYAAPLIPHMPGIGQGSAILISADVAQMIVQDKHKLLNQSLTFDDILLADFFRSRGIGLTPLPSLDVGMYASAPWELQKYHISESIFHFKIKYEQNVREKEDIAVHEELMNMFYQHRYFID